MRRLAILGVITLVGSACTYQVDYNPDYVPDEETVALSESKVQLVISERDEENEWSTRPSSFTGLATKLKVPLGKILKEVSEVMLSDRFSGGVAFSNDHSSDGDYELSFAPKIERFAYKYNDLVNAQLATTPQVEIDLSVTITDQTDGCVISRLYESGVVSGERFYWSDKTEEVNQVVHQVIHSLLGQALRDVEQFMDAVSEPGDCISTASGNART